MVSEKNVARESGLLAFKSPCEKNKQNKHNKTVWQLRIFPTFLLSDTHLFLSTDTECQLLSANLYEVSTLTPSGPLPAWYWNCNWSPPINKHLLKCQNFFLPSLNWNNTADGIWESADMSLARPGRKQDTATKLGIYSIYSIWSSIHFLAHCCNFSKQAPPQKNHKTKQKHTHTHTRSLSFWCSMGVGAQCHSLDTLPQKRNQVPIVLGGT